MSYMTLASQENTLFLLCSYFRAHPTTLLLKILGGRMHGRAPPQILDGTVPPSPPRSPPLLILSANTKSVTTVPFYPFYWRRRLLLHPGASILEVGAEGGRGDSRGSWTGREILLYLIIMYRKYV